MTGSSRRLLDQVNRQSLAIVSLVIALIALSYNTWRNEESEFNQNIRRSGFEMLVHIGELQRLTYVAHFERKRETVSPRMGWVEVLVLKDLAMLMPESEALRTEELVVAWTDNWTRLGDDDLALAAIDQAIDDLRHDVVAVLESLE